MRKIVLVVLAVVVVADIFWLVGSKYFFQKAGDAHTPKQENVQQGEVNVYSSRKAYLIQDVLDAFTQETGIKVNLITDKAPKLIARLAQEEELTPADILITTDIGNLHSAKEKGLLQPVIVDEINQVVPSYLRDPEHYWFGLTVRTRALFYAKDRVNPEDIVSYESLADPKWKGKILVRSSNNIYNQSLIASLIDEHGVEKTEQWARGLVANFARRPQGGDTDQIRAVAAGEGDIAIANSYYYGRLQASDKPKKKTITDKVGIYFPNQDDRGVHVNISGAAITKYAKHKDEAIRLLAFMLSPEMQQLFAAQNHETPVVDNVALSDTVASWGDYKQDKRSLSDVARHYVESVRLADRVGWK